MNKSDLIKYLSETQKLPVDEASVVVDSFFDALRAALVEGKRVEIRGFGSFSVKQYGSYTGRNPRSGETVAVAPKRLALFRPSNELKKLLNSKDG